MKQRLKVSMAAFHKFADTKVAMEAAAIHICVCVCMCIYIYIYS